MKMTVSKIPWCHYSTSPVVGCLMHCRFGCYADSTCTRFSPPKDAAHRGDLHVLDEPYRDDVGGDFPSPLPVDPYPFPFDQPTYHRYRLHQSGRRQPGRVFVCPMADLWGPWIPHVWQDEILAACWAEDWHKYLFLTKSPEGYRRVDWRSKPWAWLGATATNERQAFHASTALSMTGAAVRFLSLEPWLGGSRELTDVARQIQMHGRSYADWIIAGPLNGPKAASAPDVSRDAVINLVGACRDTGVAVFVKPEATKWGFTAEEVKGMQGWPEPRQVDPGVRPTFV